MASIAVQVVVVVLLVVVHTHVSFAARENFSGEVERDDWSWLSTPPYTPPVSFEHYPEAKLVIVTGASQNHAGPAKCFLRSVRLFHPDPQQVPVIVYDLGLDPATRDEIATQSAPGIEVRSFKYEEYPEYFQLVANTRGEYAWKPVIMLTVLLQTEKPVLWLDAGDRVVAPLAKMDRSIRREGVVSTATSGTIEDWVYPAQFAFFQAQALDSVYAIGATKAPTNALKRRPMLNGAIVGFTRAHKDFMRVAVPWAACALRKACIAPPGSHRGNHRQDQAALTVLTHWKHPGVSVGPIPKTLRIHQDGQTRCGADTAWGLPVEPYVPPDPRDASTERL